ncbi:hypothetical protein EUZ93_01085 [Wolbachia pipientis]|nr:hypothetical protein [Wolbachia pipientis]NEV49107.1 hypothetical protein [Wolbachia pipientis]
MIICQFISYILLNILRIILLIFFVIIGIAYLTLLERKLLRYIQIRKGPNKVGYLGLLQPISDGIKLFNKEFFFIYKSNYLIYLVCPVMLFFIIIMC